MEDNETRPAWDFKTPIETARWLRAHFVTSIEHHWRMTGVDTDEHWLEAVDRSGHGTRRQQVVKDSRIRIVIDGSEIRFRPDHASLLEMRADLHKRVEAIDAFDKRNKRERAEYERLRRKFDPTQPPKE